MWGRFLTPVRGGCPRRAQAFGWLLRCEDVHERSHRAGLPAGAGCTGRWRAGAAGRRGRAALAQRRRRAAVLRQLCRRRGAGGAGVQRHLARRDDGHAAGPGGVRRGLCAQRRHRRAAAGMPRPGSDTARAGHARCQLRRAHGDLAAPVRPPQGPPPHPGRAHRLRRVRHRQLAGAGPAPRAAGRARLARAARCRAHPAPLRRAGRAPGAERPRRLAARRGLGHARGRADRRARRRGPPQRAGQALWPPGLGGPPGRARLRHHDQPHQLRAGAQVRAPGRAGVRHHLGAHRAGAATGARGRHAPVGHVPAAHGAALCVNSHVVYS